MNVLVTHPRVPEATVREAVAAIIEGGTELGQLNPLFRHIRQLFLLPLRPKARRHWSSAACRSMPAHAAPIASWGCSSSGGGLTAA